MTVRVADVTAGSIADEMGIVRGTVLLAVNGHPLADFLDWEFRSADERLTVDACLPDGAPVAYEIEREEGVALGVELEPPSVRRCANRCEFCFIEGLPPGLRRSLYIRDDDYRLSFAYGNFATLSNLRERDYERIVEYRLSPLYVSVHATQHAARRVLLNNPNVPDVLAQLRRLAASGIQCHAQLVIVPGVNDGGVLEESLADLWSLGDAVISVAVVPVGLTQFSHLYTGRTINQGTAGEILEHAGRWAARGLRERATPWVFGSDELYLLAGAPLPGAAYYADFPQIENGVGAVALLRQRVRDGARRLPRMDGMRIGVVTGTAMAPLLPPMLRTLRRATGATFELIVRANSLFGPTIATAGLLVGADIEAALATRGDLDLALIPAESINDGRVFLDDVRFEELRSQLPMPVAPSYDFVDVLQNAAVALNQGAKPPGPPNCVQAA
jgi:putative radical SAM enzyme (TIGR03279 family)